MSPAQKLETHCVYNALNLELAPFRVPAECFLLKTLKFLLFWAKSEGFYTCFALGTSWIGTDWHCQRVFDYYKQEIRFRNCTALTGIVLERFKAQNAQFSSVLKLKLKVTTLGTSWIGTDWHCQRVFGCYKQEIMFRNCTPLTGIVLERFKTQNTQFSSFLS